tara:strand:- start:1259 stop:1453 length:195 start_codon:yes stop_codon:yes gene_type:complete
MTKVNISIAGKSTAIDKTSWEVFLAAIDFIVSSGDAIALFPQFSEDQVTKAIEDRDSIYLDQNN